MKRSRPDPSAMNPTQRAVFEAGGVSKDDLWHADDITCPYCGQEQEDIFEIHGAYGPDEGEFETECQMCGGEFGFTTHVSYSYSSARIDFEKEGEP